MINMPDPATDRKFPLSNLLYVAGILLAVARVAGCGSCKAVRRFVPGAMTKIFLRQELPDAYYK